MTTSSLYCPYRAIGYVSDGNPFCLNKLGEELFITVSIGNYFQIIRYNKLITCLVSKPVKGKITFIQANGHETFASVGKEIFVFDRNNVVRTYSDHEYQIVGLLSISNTLVSYDSGNNIKIYDTKKRCLADELSLLTSSEENISITALVHPSTYINKFIIGFSNGKLELWNFNKKKLLYVFKSHLICIDMKTSARSENSIETAHSILKAKQLNGISTLEQSPACDVVAIGFDTGDIVLLNLKLDFVLFSFYQTGGTVTSLSFRTDNAAERYPFMISGSEDGRIHVWNLGSNHDNNTEEVDHSELKVNNHLQTILERKLQHTIEEAHVGALSKVLFLYGEPIMISMGRDDNSVKVWIFDAPDGSPRLLRYRDGHRGTPTRIRYYGGTTNVSMRDNIDGMSCEMISSGSDGTLRIFNSAIESQNKEFSQKPILKKLGLLRRNERLPECVGFDFSETRQRDWGNVVSIHKDHAHAYVWKYKHRVVTEMILKQPDWKLNNRNFAIDRKVHATAVAVSPCGNFCVVATKGGVIYKYNLQSGIHRGAFPFSASASVDKNIINKLSKIPGNIYHDTKLMLGEQVTPLNAPVVSESDGKMKEDIKQIHNICGHSSEVIGIFIDMMGMVLVSTGYDGLMCFWNFLTHALIRVIDIGVPQLILQGFRDSNFVAVAGQDRIIRMYDIETFHLSRRFSKGHSREITDLAFTPDGRRLLSSSQDCTLRVWDIPTGRCLSWLLFKSPIQSMAISLSGEYLCIAQAEKQGIQMYIDKSLYETIHFWREPITPTLIEESVVHVDDSNSEGNITMNTSYDHNVDDKSDKEEVDVIEITPSQSHVITESDLLGEDIITRGPPGTITLSSTPKAYWTTLFNLEIIKKRSQPIAAPAPAPKAPFFLPSVIKGGSTPSFPTPQEYANLTESLKAASSSSGSITGNESKKRISNESSEINVTNPSKQTKLSTVDNDLTGDEHILNSMTGMTSSWTDDDHEDKDNILSVGWTIDGVNNTSEVITDQSENEVPHTVVENKRSKSKILNKKIQLPRCKLVAYLNQEQFSEECASTQNIDEDCSVLMDYLKRLPPPAVDLELRALYTYEGDEEGVYLLKLLLQWLAKQVRSGNNYEVLQAYIHRTLTIYSQTILQLPVLQSDLQALHDAHSFTSSKFRNLIQKNLCLLKLIGNLPIT